MGAKDKFTEEEVKKYKQQWLDEGKPRGKGGKSNRGGQYRSSKRRIKKRYGIIPMQDSISKHMQEYPEDTIDFLRDPFGRCPKKE